MAFGDTGGDSIKLIHGMQHKRFNTSGSRRSFRDESGGPSIPSQFQTIVIDNSEKPGFQSRSKRFDDYVYLTHTPGPGAYSSIDKTIICRSASESKKGSGGFASKTRRKNLFGVDARMPGPGYYETTVRSFQDRSDFNRANHTSTFAQPIANVVDKPAEAPPAPNAYDINRSITTNCGAQSSFKSSTKRAASFLGGSGSAPAPNRYHVKRDYTEPDPHVATSIFKSKSKRDFVSEQQSVPGPGSYDPQEKVDLSDVKRLQMPKKHYLCISAPAMPMPKPPPSPGPAAYDLPSDFPENKKYMQSSYFLSVTERTASLAKKNGPGPATYKPQPVPKQSFFYNSKGIWVS